MNLSQAYAPTGEADEVIFYWSVLIGAPGRQ